MRGEYEKLRFWTCSMSLYFRNDTRYSYTYYRMRIGNRTLAFEWYHFQWPWVTWNPDFKVTPLFDAQYLRNGTRYRHSYNGILAGTYTRRTQGCHFEWPRVTLSDLAKYSLTRSIERSFRDSWASCTVSSCGVAWSSLVTGWSLHCVAAASGRIHVCDIHRPAHRFRAVRLLLRAWDQEQDVRGDRGQVLAGWTPRSGGARWGRRWRCVRQRGSDSERGRRARGSSSSDAQLCRLWGTVVSSCSKRDKGLSRPHIYGLQFTALWYLRASVWRRNRYCNHRVCRCVSQCLSVCSQDNSHTTHECVHGCRPNLVGMGKGWPYRSV